MTKITTHQSMCVRPALPVRAAITYFVSCYLVFGLGSGVILYITRLWFVRVRRIRGEDRNYFHWTRERESERKQECSRRSWRSHAAHQLWESFFLFLKLWSTNCEGFFFLFLETFFYLCSRSKMNYQLWGSFFLFLKLWYPPVAVVSFFSSFFCSSNCDRFIIIFFFLRYYGCIASDFFFFSSNKLWSTNCWGFFFLSLIL